jgi:hypothetical protein
MQIAEVIGAAFGKGNNMVDVQWRLLSRFICEAFSKIGF